MANTEKRPLGAQLSHMLKDRGVDVIFGIPGVHNQEMYRGIEEAGITHVLARHEQGAAFMADGYARATGRPGVCYIITGPGLLNALTPLGQAYSDSVSVLAIASCLDETAARRGQLHQMLDQAGAARTVCDWSETARSAQAAYTLVDRALTEFGTQRKRPKAIHVPIAQLEGRAMPFPAKSQVSVGRAVADAVYDVAQRLQTAVKPLIIAGGGAVGANVRGLAEQLGAAVFTTYAGDGLVAGYDLDFGCYLGRPTSAEIIAQADVVMAVGTELAEVDLWRHELGHTGTLIRVDIDAEVLSDLHNPQIGLHGDATAIVDKLIELVSDKPLAWSKADISAAQTRWRSEADAERPGIVPLCDALRDVMPDNAMIYSDMTQFAYVGKEVWPMPRPGHWHHPTGFGTLGYAVPAAIGGAVGRHGLPTVAMIGDYGFQYTLPELGAAVELGLPLPILLWDNGKLKEIEDSMVGAQIPPNAVIAKNPDFVALAQAYGAVGVKPATIADLQSALLAAFQADGPTLIHMTPELTA